jgi:hypothetical protein
VRYYFLKEVFYLNYFDYISYESAKSEHFRGNILFKSTKKELY